MSRGRRAAGALAAALVLAGALGCGEGDPDSPGAADPAREESASEARDAADEAAERAREGAGQPGY